MCLQLKCESELMLPKNVCSDVRVSQKNVLPGESKKARCLMERSMKTRSLISKIGIVFDLQ